MKSVTVAVVLGVLFGPLGLLYVGVGDALAALCAGVVLGIASGGALLPLLWVACGIWAGVAVGRTAGPLAPQPIAFRPSLGGRPAVTVKLPPLGSGAEGSGKFCLQCGAHLPVSVRFCGRCGSSADAP